MASRLRALERQRQAGAHQRDGFAALRRTLVEHTQRIHKGPHLRSQRDHAQADLVARSEEHTSELQSQSNLVCRLLLEKKNERAWPITKAQLGRALDIW